MDTLVNDVRFAVRSLRKASGLTTVVILVLALGIGATTAIFSVVDAVLLRPLPYPDADRLVELDETSLDGQPDSPAPATYLDVKAQSRSFESMAAYRNDYLNLAGDREPERLRAAVVTSDFFRVFRVGAARGQTFSEGQPGDRTAVLSDGLWKRRYGGSADVLGRSIVLNGESYTIVGVMPPDFQFPEEPEVWVPARFAVPEHPLSPTEDPSASRTRHYFDVVARLAPGATTEGSQAEVTAIAQRLAEQYPSTNANRGARLVGLRETLVGDMRPALLMLFGAVGFVLLIACANVATLLVARAAARRKEMATRAALGASRWRLARQLLVESMLLSVAGGAAGLALATWGSRPLASYASASLLGGVEPSLDWRVLAFTLGASVLTGLLFGLLPALQASRVDVNDVLKEGARGSSGGVRNNRVRSVLVVFEIAISLVLLVGAGLMLKSLARLRDVEPGFDSRDLVTAQIWLPAVKYPDADRKAAFFEQVLERVRAIPGVRSAAATTRMPMIGGNSSRSFQIEGRPIPQDPNATPDADYRAVSTAYFGTMSIPVVAGREFTETDARGATAVAVVNEAFARRYFPGEDPIGERIDIGGMGDYMEIVGVVGDVHHANLATPPRPEIDVPFAQDPWPFMTVAVRSATPVGPMARALEEAVRSVDPDQPIANVATMEQLLSKSVAPRRFNASLLGVFAAIALALAAVGIYGVVSYSVTQRVHEIGIRMALGAARRDVFRLVVGQGMLLAAGGVLVGLVAAFALTRVISGLLFGVSATDPAVFAVVALLLGGAAILASLVPARRATRVDPMVALRYE